MPNIIRLANGSAIVPTLHDDGGNAGLWVTVDLQCEARHEDVRSALITVADSLGGELVTYTTEELQAAVERAERAGVNTKIPCVWCGFSSADIEPAASAQLSLFDSRDAQEAGNTEWHAKQAEKNGDTDAARALWLHASELFHRAAMADVASPRIRALFACDAVLAAERGGDLALALQRADETLLEPERLDMIEVAPILIARARVAKKLKGART